MLIAILALLVINAILTAVIFNALTSFRASYEETIGAYLNKNDEEYYGAPHDKAFNRD